MQTMLCGSEKSYIIAPLRFLSCALLGPKTSVLSHFRAALDRERLGPSLAFVGSYSLPEFFNVFSIVRPMKSKWWPQDVQVDKCFGPEAHS